MGKITIYDKIVIKKTRKYVVEEIYT